jgi:hypothetical protein
VTAAASEIVAAAEQAGHEAATRADRSILKASTVSTTTRPPSRALMRPTVAELQDDVDSAD